MNFLMSPDVIPLACLSADLGLRTCLEAIYWSGSDSGELLVHGFCCCCHLDQDAQATRELFVDDLITRAKHTHLTLDRSAKSCGTSKKVCCEMKLREEERN
jgi:hypothetical protein